MSDSSDDGPPSVEYDPEAECYRVETDFDALKPSVVVTRTVGIVRDRDPTDLPSLATHVDVAALNALRGDDSVVVSFAYDGTLVRVGMAGWVEVEPDGPE
ncbi:HalOD1 output domain-containing protein [Haloarcula litorea]|uniref:HalOD1 output domain-containing protein n=1 Tax=Haloarcula litorea TaxID=3032579 RepID=UPI0023E8F2B6|nr:HalOD1 output domain-containing protein [Halomicroarcula sp. GDY20]